jgi:uncharacterized membrane protein YedE/YeeE
VNRTAWFLLPGTVFGAGLAVSGMTNPAKVIGFLDLFGQWDPSLACVMVGAIASFVVGNFLVRRRATPVCDGKFTSGPAHNIDSRVLVGSSVFGIGWGLAGFCPGPAITNLARPQAEVLGFVVAMAIGMLIAQRVFGADR